MILAMALQEDQRTRGGLEIKRLKLRSDNLNIFPVCNLRLTCRERENRS